MGSWVFILMPGGIIILHGVAAGISVAVKIHELRGIGDEGVGADELAQLRVVVAGVHVDQAGAIGQLTGEALGGVQFGATAVAAIGVVAVVIDCVAVAVGDQQRTAQLILVEIVETRFITHGNALAIEGVIFGWQPGGATLAGAVPPRLTVVGREGHAGASGSRVRIHRIGGSKGTLRQSAYPVNPLSMKL